MLNRKKVGAGSGKEILAEGNDNPLPIPLLVIDIKKSGLVPEDGFVA